MSNLSSYQQIQVLRGECPNCGSAVMVFGERDRAGQTKLCTVCLREYRVSMGNGWAEVLHEVCPPERLRRVYGMVATAAQNEEGFP